MPDGFICAEVGSPASSCMTACSGWRSPYLVPLLPLVEVLGRKQGPDVVSHLIIADEQPTWTCTSRPPSAPSASRHCDAGRDCKV